MDAPLGLELTGSLNHDQPNDEIYHFRQAARMHHDPKNLDDLFLCDRRLQASAWMDCIVPVSSIKLHTPAPVLWRGFFARTICKPLHVGGTRKQKDRLAAVSPKSYQGF